MKITFRGDAQGKPVSGQQKPREFLTSYALQAEIKEVARAEMPAGRNLDLSVSRKGEPAGSQRKRQVYEKIVFSVIFFKNTTTTSC